MPLDHKHKHIEQNISFQEYIMIYHDQMDCSPSLQKCQGRLISKNQFV